MIELAQIVRELHHRTRLNPSRPNMLKVHLKVSKTDPFQKEVDLFIGKVSSDLCPVAVVLC